MDVNEKKDPTLAEIDVAHASPLEPHKKQRIPTPDLFTRFLILEGFSHWFFRLGFASIFFINAVYATVEPESFINMLQVNPITKLIGNYELMMRIAMVNDLLLSIFILGGWRKRMVYAWAGAWLLLVAGLKLMNLFV